MKTYVVLFFVAIALCFYATSPQQQNKKTVTLAVCANFQHAMQEICEEFNKQHHDSYHCKMVTGSSGNLYAQIINGAPYDMFFSADELHPQRLFKKGLASEPQIYAYGQLVLWTHKNSQLDIAQGWKILQNPRVKRIAIANPQHAPYGMKAEEALQYHGLWDIVQPKLVRMTNVADAAHAVYSRAAQVGIIALAIAKTPAMQDSGEYFPIDDKCHQPLAQSFTVLHPRPSVSLFAKIMSSIQARSILYKYGYSLATP